MKKFISKILCIIIFFVFFIFEININFSNAFLQKNLKKISNNLEVINPLKKENITKEELYWDAKLDIIYDNAEKYNVSRNDINKILESKEAKEFVFKYINNLSTSLLYTNSENITTQEIEIYFKDAVNNYMNNNNITSQNKKNINDFIEENSNQYINDLISTDDINSNIDSNILDTIKVFFSNKTKLILLSIIVCSIIGIVILLFKEYQWMPYIGITALISSVLNLSFTYMINPIILMITNSDLSIVISLINNFSNVIIKSYYITNIPLGLLAIIILVGYIFIKNKKLKTI